MNNLSIKESPLVIALAADVKYSEQLITLIKSICYHKHQNVKFYLLHKEFPIEWFNSINHYLKQINCEIISAKVLNDNFGDYPSTSSHINEVTYYRYYLQHIPEDRVLYLDSDTIVNGNLSEFYYTNFEDKLAVTITDMYLNYQQHYIEIRPYFNAGVLLINNQKWKENNILEKLIQLSILNKKEKSIVYGDQDILNILLHNNFITADKIYNYQTGARFGYYSNGLLEQAEEMEKLEQDPVIIHYTSPYKPWLFTYETKFRDKYWFYYQLEWNDIIKRYSE